METYQGQRLPSRVIQVVVSEGEHTRPLIETTSPLAIARALLSDVCDEPVADAGLIQKFADDVLNAFDLDLPWKLPSIVVQAWKTRHTQP